MSNPDMEKNVQGLIRKVLVEVRKNVSEAAEKAMDADPRQAHKAVRIVVYKRILGGNVNILSKRRSEKNGSSYTPPRTLVEGQWGGNRRKVSDRTKRINEYFGRDRGFILRFLDAGTVVRQTRYGSRGHIDARNFFAPKAKAEIEQAAEKLSELIDELIQKEIA